MKSLALSEITLPDMSGGLNTREPQYEIADNQSPDMLNLWFKNKALAKRPGQAMAIVNLAGSVHRISDEFNGFRVVHAGIKLYKWDEGEAKVFKGMFDVTEGYPPVAAEGDYYVAQTPGTIGSIAYETGDRAIYDGGSWHNAVEEVGDNIEDAPGVFVQFGDMLYYLDGSEAWQIDPDWEVTAVVPYAPVVMINCSADLSESDDNEAYNLLGGGFCVKYNGDGAASEYKLPLTDLDETAVLAVVDAVDKTESIDFTVVRDAENNATVTFNTAPPQGTDNVWITAYKTVEGSKEKITLCKAALTFGGEGGGVVGGTRVFVTANPDHPQSYWRSDLGLHVSSGMAYFPDTSEEYIDQTRGSITAAAKMGSELVIFKEESIFAVRYSYDGKDVYFPVRECHGAIGCDIPGSVQLIDNKLVFANTKNGVNMLISTNNELENIVKPLSANINSLLLAHSGLEQACSCDFERYYWLCVSGNVYLWDYEQTPYYNYADYEQAQKRLAWYRFGGVPAETFCAGGSLYLGFGDGIAAFTDRRDDFGQEYDAYYLSKAFDLGRPDDLKTFMYAYPSFSWDGNVKVRVSVGNENTDEYMIREFDIRSFNWSDFNWSSFTWNIIKYAKTFSMRLAMKKVSYIQIKVSGNEAERGVGLSGLRVTYFVTRKVKR